MDSQMMWTKIESFYSYDDYLKFYNLLQQQKEKGLIEQIPVKNYYAGANLDECWFKTENGHIWRLVAPDFPFKGYWGPV